MDKVRSEFEALKAHERHNNVAETRYWLQQYKQFAEKLVEALSSREGEAVALVEDLSGTASEPNQFSIFWLDKSKCAAGVRLYAAPSARVAELERMESLQQWNEVHKRRIAALESQLAASREREVKLIADLDANLEAFSDERKRALSAESLARELHELLADYVSQDSIAQGYGAGIGGTTYEKAEAFLDALAAEKGEK